MIGKERKGNGMFYAYVWKVYFHQPLLSSPKHYLLIVLSKLSVPDSGSSNNSPRAKIYLVTKNSWSQKLWKITRKIQETMRSFFTRITREYLIFLIFQWFFFYTMYFGCTLGNHDYAAMFGVSVPSYRIYFLE